MSLVLALACLAAAPPAEMPPAWQTLIGHLGSDDAGVRKKAAESLSVLHEDAIPMLRRQAARPDMDPDARLRLFVVAGAIRARHWGLVRAIGPGAAIIKAGEGERFNRVRFTPDGKRAVVAGEAVFVHDLATGKLLGRCMVKNGGPPNFDISPDGKHLLAGESGSSEVHLIELPSLRTARTFTGHQAGILSVRFSPDGKTAAAGAVDTAVRLWDIKSGKEVGRIDRVGRRPDSITFSPDGKRLLVAANARAGTPFVLSLFDTATARRTGTISPAGGIATSVAFLPDGKRIVLGTAEGDVLVIRPGDGKELKRLRHGAVINDVALSPDGLRCASAGHDRLVKVWDVEKGECLETLEGHMSAVRGAAFSPDGTRLLTCDGITTVRLWKVGRR